MRWCPDEVLIMSACGALSGGTIISSSSLEPLQQYMTKLFSSRHAW